MLQDNVNCQNMLMRKEAKHLYVQGQPIKVYDKQYPANQLGQAAQRT